MAREETSKYTDLMESGKARQFTYVMDAKSVITTPSPQAPLQQKGFTVISGLAWSGRGRIARVDVSLDGGRNWREAQDRRPAPGTRRCHASTPRSNGTGPRCCCNRAPSTRPATCSRGKTELRKMRGVNSIYHNNGIQTWLVKADGEVENVEVS